MHPWDPHRPIYQQLADRLADALLDGDPPEGEAMPSVRVLASRHLLNPLTVNRALQSLAEVGVVEARRGIGLYVTAGARERLRRAGRDHFLQQEWPLLRQRLRRLGLRPEDLLHEERQP